MAASSRSGLVAHLQLPDVYAVDRIIEIDVALVDGPTFLDREHLRIRDLCLDAFRFLVVRHWRPAKSRTNMAKVTESRAVLSPKSFRANART